MNLKILTSPQKWILMCPWKLVSPSFCRSKITYPQDRTIRLIRKLKQILIVTQTIPKVLGKIPKQHSLNSININMHVLNTLSLANMICYLHIIRFKTCLFSQYDMPYRLGISLTKVTSKAGNRWRNYP